MSPGPDGAPRCVWRDLAVDEAVAAALAGTLDVPPPLARILAARELADPAAAARYLAPRLADLGDPFALPGMRQAADRVWRAIEENEAILVYGDYDVDGLASVGLLLKVFEPLGVVAQPWLPSRMREGYGFSPASLERCLRERPRPGLIITADCGTNSVEAVRLAARSGIEVVVTDHHEPNGPLAEAVAVVNPKLGRDPALRILAGVGVAFKLCHAVLKAGRERGSDKAAAVDLRRHLGWVALGTVADIVPLRGENRILVRHGLARLNEEPSPGVSALLDMAGIKGPVDTFHIGFGLGPRLNAVGRLGDPDAALDLLLAEDLERARELASKLDAANRERQGIEGRIGDEARQDIESFFHPDRSFGLAVGRAGWHKGVVGNVASRLVAQYRRPVVVVAFEEDGRGKGSCRSVEGFSLLKGLEACAEFLEEYGGHDLAAGLEVRRDRFEAFRERFNDVAAATLAGADLRPVLAIAGWLGLADAGARLLDGLESLKPFGADNPEPVWASRGVEVADRRKVGRNHLRLTFRSGRARCQAIAFDMADRAIPDGPLDVAFRLRRDTYNGADRPQLHVLDLRRAGD